MDQGSKEYAQKRITTTEDADPPVQVPVYHRGNCYIVTHQRVRRVENERKISYGRVMRYGDVIPMERLGHDKKKRETILKAGEMQRQQYEQASSASHGAPPSESSDRDEVAEILKCIRGSELPLSFLDPYDVIVVKPIVIQEKPKPLMIANATSTTDFECQCDICSEVENNRANAINSTMLMAIDDEYCPCGCGAPAKNYNMDFDDMPKDDDDDNDNDDEYDGRAGKRDGRKWTSHFSYFS